MLRGNKLYCSGYLTIFADMPAKKRGLEFFKCSTNEEMLQIMGFVETV
jgi:hypothetical protein